MIIHMQDAAATNENIKRVHINDLEDRNVKVYVFEWLLLCGHFGSGKCR